MVICFECSRETKEQLDALVSNGNFASLSEAISVSIANQALLSKSAGSAAVVIDGEAPDPAGKGARPVQSAKQTPRIPSIFLSPPDVRREPVAPPPKYRRNAAKNEDVSQADWIFGQHNKLLPVKASCRALAHLLADSPAGIEIVEAARSIANLAADLGSYLQSVDAKFDRQRDDLLATAFPGRSDPDKGRIRYANQFVAGVTKQRQLTGLLVDLGLLNRISPESEKVSLTEAGWKFAVLPNPVLDGNGSNPIKKFSDEERAFMANHIAMNVPYEKSAYVQVLNAVHAGNSNPEKLRVAFDKAEKETSKNKLYFSTQRAGALSRMADLGLLRRERDGTRVTYEITDDGAAFLNQ